uniref:7TM GPCR serpentine receptor class x (Srx) domain-containing protein n=1 Tax=Romanomermis culicivorax TaxID=13658 RepID=A0A915K6B3_ROMCU
GLAEASWFSYLALSQLLAVNRIFWVFAGEDKVKSWFSMRRTQIYIFVCWIPGVLYTVLLALPNVDFIYMVDIGTFGPIYSPTIEVFFVVNLVIDITHSVSEILWYALIYLKIKF